MIKLFIKMKKIRLTNDWLLAGIWFVIVLLDIIGIRNVEQSRYPWIGITALIFAVGVWIGYTIIAIDNETPVFTKTKKQ